MNKTPSLWRCLFASAAIFYVAGLFFYGVRSGAIPREDPFAAYQDKEWSERRPASLGFRFEDVTERSGIRFRHDIYEPSDVGMNRTSLRLSHAGVSATDFDGDGFVDLFFVTLKDGEPNRLYRNVGGWKFEDVTEKWGLGADKNDPWGTVTPFFFDYDNDGRVDLFLARTGCHTLYRNTGRKFVDVSAETGVDRFCTDATHVNVFDFDGDGFLDIYVTNYNLPGALKDRVPSRDFVGVVSHTGNNRESGPNLLLRNVGGKKFEDASESSGLADPGLSWAAGILDADLDGKPDVYVANDFGVDKFYRNLGDGRFRDESAERLGMLFGRSSMSAEVGDANNDGLPDVYITNTSRIGFSRGLNYFWINSHVSFFDRAREYQVDRCGWGWGAKFIDADRDGRLDIFSANGFWGKEGEKSYWFAMLTTMALPSFLRSDLDFHVPTSGLSMAAGHRNCLFLRTDNGYFDVGLEAGFHDYENGRGVAAADFDNDGATDIVIANLRAEPILYRNVPMNDNAWLGIELSDKGRIPYGARVYVKTNKLLQSRELYTGNGFNAQSESRLLFGMGKDPVIEEAYVVWPDGSRQDFRPVLSRYVKVVKR